MARATVKSHTRHGLRLHPLPLRIMHWINAVAMIIMIGSGWKIYNDEVLFGWLHFPDWITIGGEAQHALQWHFFAMWILVLNGLAYLIYGLVTGRFRRMLLPIRLRELIADRRDALRCISPMTTSPTTTPCRSCSMSASSWSASCQVLSGLAIWKPVQFSELSTLFYELPERAPGAFPRHGRDRRLPRRACRAGAARAEDHRSP